MPVASAAAVSARTWMCGQELTHGCLLASFFEQKPKTPASNEAGVFFFCFTLAWPAFAGLGHVDL